MPPLGLLVASSRRLVVQVSHMLVDLGDFHDLPRHLGTQGTFDLRRANPRAAKLGHTSSVGRLVEVPFEVEHEPADLEQRLPDRIAAH